MCPTPACLSGLSEQQYREHYEHEYCMLGPIMTCDGIPVYFDRKRFNHAFYRPADRKGRKDTFCPERAERMPWIKATLENPNAELYQGWISKTRMTDPLRRVSIAYGDYVVVIELSLKKDGQLKARFVTAFLMEAGADKVRSNPKWCMETALRALGGRQK